MSIFYNNITVGNIANISKVNTSFIDYTGEFIKIGQSSNYVILPNVSSNNLSSTLAYITNLNVSGNLSANNISTLNLSSTNAFISSLNIVNLSSDNLSTTNASIASLIVKDISANNISSINLRATNASFSSLIGGDISFNQITSTSAFFTTMKIDNMSSDNASANNMSTIHSYIEYLNTDNMSSEQSYITWLNVENASLNNTSISNLSTTNTYHKYLNTDNMSAVLGYMTSLNADNASFDNMSASNVSITTLKVNSIVAGNISSENVSTTNASISQLIVTNTSTINLSTQIGFIYDSLNVSGNISTSLINAGTIFTTNLDTYTNSNLSIGNINTSSIVIGRNGINTNINGTLRVGDSTNSNSLYQYVYTSAISNVKLGYHALYNASTYNTSNTGIGYHSLESITTGIGNTALGYQALNNATGNYNIAIGYDAGETITNLSKTISIGSSATKSNQILIGNITDYSELDLLVSGCVGINTSIPNSNYKLDISGITQSTSLFTSNLSTTNVSINSYLFQYVPWTTYYSGNSLTGIVSAITTDPTCDSGASVTYRYSIIGNTMYLNYTFYSVTGGSDGVGKYLYSLPSGITVNTTGLITSTSSTNGNIGTKLGHFSVMELGTSNGSGHIYLDTNNKLLLWVEYSVGENTFYNKHQSDNDYGYGTASLKIAFEATIPII